MRKKMGMFVSIDVRYCDSRCLYAANLRLGFLLDFGGAELP